MSVTYAQKAVVINGGQDIETQDYIGAVIFKDGLYDPNNDSYLKKFGNVINLNMSVQADAALKDGIVAVLPEQVRPKKDINVFGLLGDSSVLTRFVVTSTGEVRTTDQLVKQDSVLINHTWVI
ncbi:hypothetical protein [Photobacterium damselae]|uniref:hypothetical protein n=1 Tax=Photobacterium damselae TaxID=38293 RepID=UPI00083B1C59|nr:hypothetical protein [Photobacterium damselae]ODA24581.1 hypothetical protein A0J46_16205 [Photobacterium damselae subsp. damselae]TLS70790.1 hypothetical protein FD718_05540 [Photobacterium damselae subsp. damselae]